MMGLPTWLTLAVILSIAFVLGLGCAGDLVIPHRTGSLEVVTGTSGKDTDDNGYIVRVDDGEPTPIGPEATLSLSAVAAGDHVVQLAGVAENCSSAEGLTQTVTVAEGSVAVARFTVSCTDEDRGRDDDDDD